MLSVLSPPNSPANKPPLPKIVSPRHKRKAELLDTQQAMQRVITQNLTGSRPRGVHSTTRPRHTHYSRLADKTLAHANPGAANATMAHRERTASRARESSPPRYLHFPNGNDSRTNPAHGTSPPRPRVPSREINSTLSPRLVANRPHTTAQRLITRPALRGNRRVQATTQARPDDPTTANRPAHAH